MIRLIIFGPPGAGKGTQAELLASKLNLDHFSTGQILRDAVSAGTELGLKAKEIMDSGNLVPDDIMTGVVKDALSAPTQKNGFILDGFPRTVEQSRSLSVILNDLSANDVKIVNVEVTEDELIRRLLLRGRSDDTELTIRNRLKVYHDQTSPVLSYYEDTGADIVNIEGLGEIETINRTIIEKLGLVS